MPLLKSILVMWLVATGIALPFSHSPIDYLKYTFAICIIQVLLYNIYRSFLKIKKDEIELKKIKEYSNQGCNVICPCDKAKKIFIPIRLNRDNSFKCLDCTRNVAVKVDVSTFLTTDMLDLNKEDKKLIDVIKNIKDKGE